MRIPRHTVALAALCASMAPAAATPLQILGDAQLATVPYNGTPVTLATLASTLLTVASTQATGLTATQAALLASALQPNGTGSGLGFTSGSTTRTGVSLLADQLTDETAIANNATGVTANASAIASETARAKSAEVALSNQIGGITTGVSAIRSFNTQTGSAYTVTASDCSLGKMILMKGSAAAIVTIPSGLTSGCQIDIEQDTASAVTILPGTGMTIASVPSGKSLSTAGIGQYVSLVIAGSEIVVQAASTLVTAAAAPALGHVFIGGISSDMTNLAVPADTALFRKAGGGLYVHESWLVGGTGVGPAQTTGCSSPSSTATPSANLTAVESAFAGQPAPLMEIGLPTGFNSGDVVGLQQLIKCNTQSAGIMPAAVLVNILIQGTASGATQVSQPTTLAQWQLAVDTLRSDGIPIVMPVASPNTPGFDNPAFSTAEWDLLRQMALYGGGWAFDSPPSEYVAWGSTVTNNPYTQFHSDALAWAAQNNLKTVMILSAYSQGLENNSFQSDVQNWIGAVTAAGNSPTSYGVENYTPDAGSPNGGGKTLPTIGTDTTSPSLLITALWIAQHAF